MRFVIALSAIVLAPPAFAAVGGTGSLTPTWEPLPTQHFSAWERIPAVRVATARTADISEASVAEAVASAMRSGERRELNVNELAAGWEPARRSALEDLRDAQRAYAEAAGGDTDARGQRFVGLLELVVNSSGRSVASSEPARHGDDMLNQVYDKVIRDASDSRLAEIKASETAWIAYRDAFNRFALVMDRADVARTVHDDLARHRADELQAPEEH